LEVTDRWATFDCYGTLIDWNGGIRAALTNLWPSADLERLLARHHAIEPLVQEARSLRYREVGARTLRAIAAVEDLPLAPEKAFAFADSLPSWPAFSEVPSALEEVRRRGWKLAILSNTDPDLLQASLRQIGVPVDLAITAAEAGSYKPAHGHWQRFFEQSGAERDHHVHVAASLFHDIAPCAEQGISAVWIDRVGEQTSLPMAARLPDLADLPATLDRLISA
jgi:2-haloacid dehalogenase